MRASGLWAPGQANLLGVPRAGSRNVVVGSGASSAVVEILGCRITRIDLLRIPSGPAISIAEEAR